MQEWAPLAVFRLKEKGTSSLLKESGTVFLGLDCQGEGPEEWFPEFEDGKRLRKEAGKSPG